LQKLLTILRTQRKKRRITTAHSAFPPTIQQHLTHHSRVTLYTIKNKSQRSFLVRA